MALTVQKKLELAGDLARVEEPKRRFGGRGIVLVVSVISAIGAVTALAVLWRQGRLDVAVDDLQADFPIEDALPAEHAVPTIA